MRLWRNVQTWNEQVVRPVVRRILKLFSTYNRQVPVYLSPNSPENFVTFEFRLKTRFRYQFGNAISRLATALDYFQSVGRTDVRDKSVEDTSPTSKHNNWSDTLATRVKLNRRKHARARSPERLRKTPNKTFVVERELSSTFVLIGEKCTAPYWGIGWK